MQLVRCSVNVEANGFTAKTFIELEFFNPHYEELEGLYQFKLEPGQVITGFQLDLHGKYRDGSIEEKWKATTAYNTIVGKRIDPALLTWDYNGNYSLRIYPVPAKGSRKVTITIEQALKIKAGKIVYSLPFNVRDTVSDFRLRIDVAYNTTPHTGHLIKDLSFLTSGEKHWIYYRARAKKLDSPITFLLPLNGADLLCKKNDAAGQFILRLQPSSEKVKIQPASLTVFWDASALSDTRDVRKEIQFLRDYMQVNRINEVTIIPFNHKLIDTAMFFANGNGRRSWENYLYMLDYKGATQLGVIDLSKVSDGVCMIFSDGRNSYGRSRPREGHVVVYTISSGVYINAPLLQSIASVTGGSYINLDNTTLTSAVSNSAKVNEMLMKVVSKNRNTVLDQLLPLKLEENMILSGTTTADDIIELHYGYSNKITRIETVGISGDLDCSTDMSRFRMLNSFEKIVSSSDWNNILDFGLKEKVVTPNTAYIVLERLEDYVKYNIEPPVELKEECEKINYVKVDTRFQRKKQQTNDELTILQGVAAEFTRSLQRWDANAAPMTFNLSDLQFGAFAQSQTFAATDKSGTMMDYNNQGLFGDAAFSNGALQEVVVTSAFGVKRSQRTTPFSSQSLSMETLNSIPQTSVVDALAGKIAGVQVRSVPGSVLDRESSLRIRGSMSLTDIEPVYVLDGTVVSADDINVSDVQEITVLKGANATALYGERARGGAIVATTKQRGRTFYYNDQYRSYRLKDMPNVKYMDEIMNAPVYEKQDVYEKLLSEYFDDRGFYYDMAQHFFEAGLKEEAFDILMEAAERQQAGYVGLTLTATILENWKMFKEAISIYEQLVEDHPTLLHLRRSLALALYQDGQLQQAVQTYYDAIKFDSRNFESVNVSIKATMLNEMNAVIHVHKDVLDVSMIPQSLIRPMPVDLRITVDNNAGYTAGMSVREPDGKLCSSSRGSRNASGFIISPKNYYQYGMPIEYQIKNARKGTYKISVDYHGAHYGGVPGYVRVITFKNFGSADQSIQIENIAMDNQYGHVQITQVNFEKK